MNKVELPKHVCALLLSQGPSQSATPGPPPPPAQSSPQARLRLQFFCLLICLCKCWEKCTSRIYTLQVDCATSNLRPPVSYVKATNTAFKCQNPHCFVTVVKIIFNKVNGIASV